MITELEIRSYRANLPWPKSLVLDIEYARVRRSPRVARLLAWAPVVGWFGGAWFYLRQPQRGWRQVRLTLLFLVPGLVTWLVDAVRAGRACDAYNREQLRGIFVRLRGTHGMAAPGPVR